MLVKGVDIHKDTPTEILHTILLGIVKYWWGQSVHIIEKSKQMTLLQMRLASLDTSSLGSNSFNAEYICTYKGALIGKHFKILAQVMPFIVYDMVPQTVLNGWITIGRLVVLLWHARIPDVEEYIAHLTHVINDFLNITAQCTPSIIIQKPKFHFLVHLPMYIHRFGPAILYSTERYESFNHVFRLSSIHSNRKAPSRDTCSWFAKHDAIKHITSGGFWFDKATGKWCQAGSEILRCIASDRKQAEYIGLWVPSDNDTTARVSLPPREKDEQGKLKARVQVRWTETKCYNHRRCEDGHRDENTYYQAASIAVLNGDIVEVGKNVIVNVNSKVSHVHRLFFQTLLNIIFFRYYWQK